MQHVGMGFAHPPFFSGRRLILDAARAVRLLFYNRMKLLILCPIPVEYTACRETLSLRELPALAGCRSSFATEGEAELFCLETGPGKARAVAGALLGIQRYAPDLVVDSGSCAGVEPGAAIGQIVLARECFEADLAGTPFPRRLLPEMRLPSAFGFLPPKTSEALQREAVERGEPGCLRIGNQACGEFLIHSSQLRSELHEVFRAAAGNWETAGVFIAALRSCLPALSFRIVTDLGDRNALRDFRRQVRPRARELYRYLSVLLKCGWFGRFLRHWGRLEPSLLASLPSKVLP
jgi:adenosylhomocysteine nucleosidase